MKDDDGSVWPESLEETKLEGETRGVQEEGGEKFEEY